MAQRLSLRPLRDALRLNRSQSTVRRCRVNPGSDRLRHKGGKWNLALPGRHWTFCRMRSSFGCRACAETTNNAAIANKNALRTGTDKGRQ